MEELKTKLNELLKIKQARYLTTVFLGKDLTEQVINATPFLQPEHRLQERIYCIVNDISHHTACPCCHKEADIWHKFDEPKEDYLNHFCSCACTRNFTSYIVNFPIDITTVIPKDKLIEKLKENDRSYNPVLINSTRYYLEQMNIDCSKFSVVQAYRFILDGLTEIPKCPVCGKHVRYHNSVWEQYCSTKCNANSSETIAKKEVTVNERYGVDNVFQSQDIKNKMKETKLDRYDDPEYRGREKSIVKVNRNTYENLARFKHICTPEFTIDEFDGCGYDKFYKWKCVACGNIFSDWYKNGEKPRCTNCFKLIGGNSGVEDELFDFVNGLFNRSIDIVKGTKKIIPPLQLDIYIPSMNIAVEFDGLYWHSDKRYDKNYHLDKTEQCRQKGIRLIHIFEDEWLYKKNIVRNRLKKILGFVKYKIHARKCEVVEISNDIKNNFLNKYHIQGQDNASVRLGLSYKNRLVSVMTFTKNRYKNEDESYELSRYATISSFNVMGGAGKLVSYFEKNFNPKILTTFADRRWSVGNLYDKLGFQMSHVSPPNYWYFRNNDRHRLSREMFQKHKLKTILSKFDENLTEVENMTANGYFRIFDCGNLVYKKTY